MTKKPFVQLNKARKTSVNILSQSCSISSFMVTDEHYFKMFFTRPILEVLLGSVGQELDEIKQN